MDIDQLHISSEFRRLAAPLILSSLAADGGHNLQPGLYLVPELLRATSRKPGLQPAS
jgi:hypothetical protein